MHVMSVAIMSQAKWHLICYKWAGILTLTCTLHAIPNHCFIWNIKHLALNFLSHQYYKLITGDRHFPVFFLNIANVRAMLQRKFLNLAFRGSKIILEIHCCSIAVWQFWHNRAVIFKKLLISFLIRSWNWKKNWPSQCARKKSCMWPIFKEVQIASFCPN